MIIYKIRDKKTGNYLCEDSSFSATYARIFYSLEAVRNFLVIRGKEEKMLRECNELHGIFDSGSLIPKSWELVEFEINESKVLNINSLLR
jgi:hypothetical protein